eukprot:CAMPEP_0203828004 /NCGR_PEP_ID=MMETSP0115-20131106/60310_1 /ASSEMBLY_ACC=CAM_ASM_000227 /TAXON_ID=33651 /ORGANISM="Bicosoecid sp, Strain ms1" /LENGTH=67 /DNA_ID=CAMNT_0050737063 /DNA_START=63 /DNA_END=263 /DNA_ORIENTATION=-
MRGARAVVAAGAHAAAAAASHAREATRAADGPLVLSNAADAPVTAAADDSSSSAIAERFIDARMAGA